MGNEKKNEEGQKGFTVKDKRFSAKKEETPEPQAEKETRPEEASGQDTFTQEGPLPEIDFTHFVFSISTSALIQLGEVQDPFTQETAKNLPLAKQTIDLIGMLKEKTKGNLSPEEEKLIESVLYDLRMRYVKASA